MRERSRFGVAAKTRTRNAAAVARPPIHCLRVQRRLGRDQAEPENGAFEKDFELASITLLSSAAGTRLTVQLERECEVLRSVVTTAWQSGQDSRWAETDWARLAESSPS